MAGCTSVCAHSPSSNGAMVTFDALARPAKARTSPNAQGAIFPARDDVPVWQDRDAVDERSVSGERVDAIAFHGPDSDFAADETDLGLPTGTGAEGTDVPIVRTRCETDVGDQSEPPHGLRVTRVRANVLVRLPQLDGVVRGTFARAVRSDRSKVTRAGR